MSTVPLQLDEEVRAITQKIRASDHRDLIELTPLWAARPDDLLQALNQHKPHIVHFSGHGSSSGEIVLVGHDGDAKPVTARALKSLFVTMRDNIRLVVLNACYSARQARSIASVVGCAVGMTTAVTDSAAIIFAAAFYRAVGFGRSVADAFQQGKVALLLEGHPDSIVPRISVKKRS